MLYKPRSDSKPDKFSVCPFILGDPINCYDPRLNKGQIEICPLINVFLVVFKGNNLKALDMMKILKNYMGSTELTVGKKYHIQFHNSKI